MAARERASAVVKTYLERAVFLQQEWEDRYIRKKAGAGSSEITQTKSGAKQEGAFTLAAAVSLCNTTLHCIVEPLCRNEQALCSASPLAATV